MREHPGGLEGDREHRAREDRAGDRLSVPLIVVALWGVLFAGCGRDRNPVGSDAGGILHAIHGVLRSGEDPTAGTVYATLLTPSAGSPAGFEASTQSDSTGIYSVVVPPGGYRLSVYSLSGNGVYSRNGLTDTDHADTVWVADEPVRADIVGGAVRVHVDLPDSISTSGIDCRAMYNASSGVPGRRFGAGWRHADFMVSMLIPRWYHLRLRGESWSVPIIESSSSGSDSVQAVAGQTADVYGSVAPLVRIRGRVTGSWLRLHTKAPTIELDSRPGVAMVSTTAADDGTYTLRLPGPVEAKMLVRIGGIGRWLGGTDFAGAALLRLAPGADTTGVDLSESGILLLVMVPEEAICTEGAVTLLDGSRPDVTIGTVVADLLDPVPLPNLDSGTYLLRVAPHCYEASWIPQWFDHKSGREEATAITVGPNGEVVSVSMSMERGGRILGRTRTGPLGLGEYVTVIVSPADSLVQEFAAEPDRTTGEFVVPGIPDGQFRLGASIGYRGPITWYPGTTDFSHSTVIEIVGHADAGGYSWEVPR